MGDKVFAAGAGASSHPANRRPADPGLGGAIGGRKAGSRGLETVRWEVVSHVCLLHGVPVSEDPGVDPMFHADDTPRPPAIPSQGLKTKVTRVATRLLVLASTGCDTTAAIHRLPGRRCEAGVPGAPAFGKIERMTTVGAAQGRNRHQPGADAVRGAWTRIRIRDRGIPRGCARKATRYLFTGRRRRLERTLPNKFHRRTFSRLF